MAIARSSFYIVNLSPPKQQQKPDHLKPCNYFQSKTTVQAQQTRWKIKKDVQEEESWKRRSQLYVGGMAIIIGLEIGGLNLIHQYYNNSSSTSNSNSNTTSSNYAVNIEVVHEEYDYQKKIAKLTKWSDKRMCPQWKLNSLESIVPENLPRPSAHRRWEAVAYSNYKTNAPSVKTSTNCFAM